MKKSLKVLFFGNERIATGIESRPLVFESLLESNHQVVGLVVHLSQGSGRKKRTEPVIELAEHYNIPVLNPSSLKGAAQDLASFGADIGVLVAYGKIIPQEIINLFSHGIINLHPSLLPLLRGSTPIETVIREGITNTGVSIMELSSKMDAGDIYRQETAQAIDQITKQELADQLHKMGANLLMDVLGSIESAQKTPQDESAATYTQQITKADSAVDLSKPAIRLEREIRAYAGWPGSWVTIGSMRLKIIEATAEDIPIDCDPWIIYNTAIYLKCGDGLHLRLDRVQPENKKEMPIKAFLAGYGNQLFTGGSQAAAAN